MDGVSWSTTRAQESFSRPRTSAETLTKLASFIARADAKPHSHRQRQSHLSLYICQECGKGFSYASDLLHHQDLEHILPKPHRCPSCRQEFSLKSSLQLHKCDQDSILCEICHGEAHHSSPCFACTTRKSDPGRPPDMSSHCQPHHLDRSPYACAPCGRGFSQKQALLHHQQAGCGERSNTSSLPHDSPPVSEGDSTHSDSSDTPGSSSNMCQFCSRAFRTKAGLQRHHLVNHADEWPMGPQGGKGMPFNMNGDPVKRTKSKKKLLTCRSCDMVFRRTSELYLHRKEKHSRETNVRREPRPVTRRSRRGGTYPCQVCGKVFLHHLSIRAHYRQHTASSFTAITNKYSTKDSQSAPNQVQNISENKPVKAGPGRPRKVPKPENNQTDPGGRREVTGMEELLEEDADREFPCPSCAEVFSQQLKLKEHIELHQSSVKRRQCSVCTNDMDTCKWPGSKKHRLYHCVPCQQGFSALDSFLEHCQEHLRKKVEEDSISEGFACQASKAGASV
ncbi:zinc finger protein 260 [Antennarius striatus]|uniref:zinc finger protein 260 n=1 Tax=Antennarius striatus TaxID=241820 RepID=UPI0035ADF781